MKNTMGQDGVTGGKAPCLHLDREKAIVGVSKKGVLYKEKCRGCGEQTRFEKVKR